MAKGDKFKAAASNEKASGSEVDTSTDTNTKSETFVEDRVAVANLGTLAELLGKTLEGNEAFLFTSDDTRSKFPDEFYFTNADIKNDAGEIATRLSPEGVEYAKAHPVPATNDLQSTGPVKEGARKKTGFKRPDKIDIDEDVALPPATRSSRSDPAYPFDKLNVGNSFHIAATDACQLPAKSVASSVTTAIRKYGIPMKNEDGSNVIEEVSVRGKDEKQPRIVMKMGRKFIIRSVGKDDPRGEGCRVYRVEPDSGDRIYAEP